MILYDITRFGEGEINECGAACPIKGLAAQAKGACQPLAGSAVFS